MDAEKTPQAWPAALPDDLPEPLEEEALRCRHALDALGWPASAPGGAACLRLWLASPLCREAIEAEPQLWRAIGEQALSIDAGQVRQRLHGAVAGSCGQQAQHRLHQAIRREHVTIAAHDILGMATLEEVFAALCALQEEAVLLALQLVCAAMAPHQKTPQDHLGRPVSLAVLALGKLGGLEPNFSSDLDLLFAYPDEELTEGGGMDPGHFYTLAAQRLIRLLSERTVPGGSLRLDTRLRPFGNSGPLVMSCTMLERYYEEHGRAWERCALIRLRPVAGQGRQVASLLEHLRPFVYRRYLDYGAIGALRDVHAMISQQAMRRGAEDNIKIGPGGIRMVEFAVQVLQLIHGGRDAALQCGAVLATLGVLDERRLLPQGHVQVLQDAYRFLRTLENRLQEMRASQTHSLPESAVERARLAHAMGFSDWPALLARLDGVREQVMAIFFEVFAAQRVASRDGEEGSRETLRLLWQEGPGTSQGVELLERLGFKEALAIQHELMTLKQSRFVLRLDVRGVNWLEQLVPAVLLEAAHMPAADLQHLAVQRLFGILQSIGQRSGYLALLAERPQVLQRLMRLILASNWIFQAISRQPVLLDELLHPGSLDIQGEFATTLRRQLDGATDLEHAMDVQRELKERAFLSVAAAQLDGRLDAVGAGEALTAVAEHILQASLALAWQQWRDRGAATVPPLAVIGYGRLGAGELGYASDLDLVFLGDGMEAMQATALVRRLIHLLSTRTRAGIAFQVDTRLRPSGQAGLLIGTMDGFADYQLHRAWVWEHLALVHSRFVAGDEAVGLRFEALRRSVLAQHRTPGEVWEAVAEMRRRLAAATEGKDDLKRSPGGLLDVRFMVSGLVLIHAAAHPALLEPRGVVPLLRCMQQLAIVPSGELDRLLEDFIQLQAADQRHVLHGAVSDVRQGEEMAAIRARLARMWDNTPWLAC